MSKKKSIKIARACRLVSASTIFVVVAITLTLAGACRSSSTPKGEVVVSAPATGVVRSVLVGDGAAIEKDAAIIEIAVSSQGAKDQTSPQQKEEDAQQARAAIAARNEAVAAEAEANRTLVELQRIEPLVKRGLASQAELDKARAQNQDAQDRLQRAREKAKSAEQRRNEPPPGTVTSEEIVAVRAPAAGKIRQINVQAGQQVTAGQALATVSSGS